MENMTTEKILQLLIATIEQDKKQNQIVIDTLTKQIILLENKIKNMENTFNLVPKTK